MNGKNGRVFIEVPDDVSLDWLYKMRSWCGTDEIACRLGNFFIPLYSVISWLEEQAQRTTDHLERCYGLSKDL